MQGGCKALFKKLYFTFCSSQTARLNHRRMFHQIYFAVFFPPSRDHTEYRTKSSALTFLLKPLQSSSTCVSISAPFFLKKNTLCSLDSVPVSRGGIRSSSEQSTSTPKLLYSGYIKLISCENSQLVYNKCTVNQIQLTWQTLLHTSQIFNHIIFILASYIYTSKVPPHCLLRVCLSDRMNNIFTSQEFFCSLTAVLVCPDNVSHVNKCLSAVRCVYSIVT